MLNKLVVIATVLALCAAQDYEEYQPSSRQHSPAAARYVTEAPKQDPIAILKQINRHNEDGSYTYGYEGADGSFKIETKSANGEVKGKYGYVDGEGKQRVVEYGANKYGFQPSGEGITVAPINYNDVKDYEEEAQQYVPQQKQAQKAPRPQSFNYAAPPPQVVEKRKPVYAAPAAPAPAPQYYDYEEEVQTTPRPVQIARPKYSVPSNRPASFPTFDDFVPEQRPVKQQQPVQYQQFENRQPHQFPNEAPAPVPSSENRADQFALFSPAPRADTYKPKYAQYEQEPQPQYQYAPQPAAPQAPAPQRPSFASRPAQARTTSVLDQLAKDPQYTLAQSSPALHDISFGYSL